MAAISFVRSFFECFAMIGVSYRDDALCTLCKAGTAKRYAAVLGYKVVNVVSGERNSRACLKLTNDLGGLNSLAGRGILNHSGGVKSDNRTAVLGLLCANCGVGLSACAGELYRTDRLGCALTGNINLKSGVKDFTFSFTAFNQYASLIASPYTPVVTPLVSGENLTVSVSVDGSNWGAVAFTTMADGNWTYAMAPFTLPADASKLYVSECFVCAGPTLKRIMPRAKGSADRILKRTSHVTMVVKERD